MQWYAAHIILYVKLKQKTQQRFPFWENIVLIKAQSEEEAFEKAERRGGEQAGDDGTFRWDGKPAEWVFAGVRKLTLCEEEDSRPGDGTEVSYLEMEVDSKAALTRLLNGQPVRVMMRDKFGDEESVNGIVNAHPQGSSVQQ